MREIHKRRLPTVILAKVIRGVDGNGERVSRVDMLHQDISIERLCVS